MVENKVTVFFHGHDHFYGKQEKDGVIYQEVPQPSGKNITNISAAEYGYINGLLLPGRGYLSVTIANSAAKVEYIRTYLPEEENASRKNGEVADSYTITSSGSGVEDVKEIPASLKMDQNYPNPFNHETTVIYHVPSADLVQLKVINSLGIEVAVLVNEYQQSGNYSVSIISSDLSLPDGVYYLVLRTPKQSAGRQMIILN